MAISGRKPKEGQVRHRVPPRHDWTEVEDRPFRGPWPFRLPRRPSVPVVVDGEVVRWQSQKWPEATKRWWDTIRHMPHCVLWTRADWQFALDTAEVHARWVETGKGATELRIRESRMGTTMDARRDLRIRYVEPKGESKAADKAKAADKGKVVSMNDYRDL